MPQLGFVTPTCAFKIELDSAAADADGFALGTWQIHGMPSKKETFLSTACGHTKPYRK